MEDRKALEAQLDKLVQQRERVLRYNVETGWQAATLGELQDLDAKINAVARDLRPRSPEAALRQAHWRQNLKWLGERIDQRSRWQLEPQYASEAVRIRLRWLERRIFDQARQLNPESPQTAITLAAGQAALSERSTAGRDRLLEISGRLRRLARVAEPSQLARVSSVLGDLKRLEQLEREARIWAKNRAELPHRGNVTSLEIALRTAKDPRKVLEAGLERLYVQPDEAREALKTSWRKEGTYGTVLRFEQHPSSFGRLKSGVAPEEVTELAQTTLRADWQRAQLDDALESAKQYRDVQLANREIVRALPDQQTLLSELGRHMEGLELHQVHPVMLHGQARMIQDVRRAELTYLEPLRQASERMPRLLNGESTLTLKEAQSVLALFQAAPEHIIRRLGAPQVQVMMVAVSMVRAFTRRAAKTMAV